LVLEIAEAALEKGKFEYESLMNVKKISFSEIHYISDWLKNINDKTNSIYVYYEKIIKQILEKKEIKDSNLDDEERKQIL
jgi:hypothetical protein